jgi:hypothetical protein
MKPGRELDSGGRVDGRVPRQGPTERATTQRLAVARATTLR